MLALKVGQTGNSLSLTLPKEVQAKLKIEKGDVLYLTETPDGYRLTPYAPDFAEQMKVARRIMRENRDALRELAK